MTPIKSSFLKAHDYDPTSRVLTIEYQNGARYRHHDVPADKFEAFIGAASPGSFYNKRIKDHHPGRKV